jgi:hypothetical protein
MARNAMAIIFITAAIVIIIFPITSFIHHLGMFRSVYPKYQLFDWVFKIQLTCQLYYNCGPFLTMRTWGFILIWMVTLITGAALFIYGLNSLQMKKKENHVT